MRIHVFLFFPSLSSECRVGIKQLFLTTYVCSRFDSFSATATAGSEFFFKRMKPFVYKKIIEYTIFVDIMISFNNENHTTDK